MKLLERMQDALEQKVSSVGHDETALQQSRFWMKTVLWSMMGTTASAIGWLAIAKTEEIVVAKGKLEPIGAVKEVQMPIGGIAKRILVPPGDQVKAGQLVMQLDTETSEQKKPRANLRFSSESSFRPSERRYVSSSWSCSVIYNSIERKSKNSKKLWLWTKRLRLVWPSCQRKVPLANSSTYNNATRYRKGRVN